MKDLDEVNYVIGIQLFEDWKNKMIATSYSSYIDKVFEKFAMQDSKKRWQPSRIGITLLLDDCLKTFKDKEYMEENPYALVVVILMYSMLCTRTDLYYAMAIVKRD